MEDPQVNASIAELLVDAGLDTRDLAVETAGSGGNNRVFVVLAGDVKYLAKIFYSHPADKRNRLGAEYAFLSYARDIGLRCVPKPISFNSKTNIGLYQFIEGKKLSASELSSGAVRQAARFFLDLNMRPNRDRAGTLPTASEACFSVAEHFALVEHRVRRLRAIPPQSEVDRRAVCFVEELGAAWLRLKERISRAAESSELTTLLAAVDRCVSPSDFGFHNALVRNTGEIYFIDFEYAGWDDPAKAVGDFFCQPAVPVSLDHFDAFLAQALSYSPNAGAMAERVCRLLPVFQIKWCCIILNEFLPDAAQRRRFANPTTEPEIRKRQQLEKAEQFFQSIAHKSWPT